MSQSESLLPKAKILVVCSSCAAEFTAPSEMAGRTTKCRTCKTPLTIPGLVLSPAPSHPSHTQQAQPDVASHAPDRSADTRLYVILGVIFGTPLAGLVATLFFCCGLPTMLGSCSSNQVAGGTGAASHGEPSTGAGAVAGVGSKPGKEDPRLMALQDVYRSGDFELSVASAAVQAVRLTLDGVKQPRTSERVYLVLTLHARNTGQSKIIEYPFWTAQNNQLYFDKLAAVKDDHGNQYKRIRFGGAISEVDGVASDTRLRPGYDGTTVIVYETPVDAAGHLDIDIPTPGGTFAKFRLPVGQIER